MAQLVWCASTRSAILSFKIGDKSRKLQLHEAKGPDGVAGPLEYHRPSDSPGSISLNPLDFRHYRRGFLAAATKGDAAPFPGAMTRQFGSFLLQDPVPQHFEHRRGAEVPRWSLPL